MAETKCPLCQSRSFESVVVTPINDPTAPVRVVQCANCGAALTAYEPTNVTALISALERDVRVALYALGLRQTTKKPGKPSQGDE